TTATPVQRMALKTMVITKSFQSRPRLQADSEIRVETRSGLLPMEERKRILAQYFRKQDWSTPSVREKAKQLIDEEIKNAPADSDTRIIASSVSNAPIIVTRPGTDISDLVKGTSHPRPTYVASSAPPPPEQISTPPTFKDDLSTAGLSVSSL